MTIEYREMLSTDYDAALALWQRCVGMGLSRADEKIPMTRFLERNPGLSFIALEGDLIIGTALCGTDGRRGYLYHLAVDPAYRRHGIGTELVSRVFAKLNELEVDKCHIMVYATNEVGLVFWNQDGWVTRPEIVLMSKDVRYTQKDSGC